VEYFAAIDCRWVVSGENEICTLPRSSQACILYPSNLISSSQFGAIRCLLCDLGKLRFDPSRRRSRFSPSPDGGRPRRRRAR